MLFGRTQIMIKLKELLDINYPSVDLFSESPLRTGKWNVSQLEPFGSNRMFTIGIKEKAKLIGKYGKYDIYKYLTKDGYTIDCFVSSDDTLAFFQYKVINGMCAIHRIWQDTLQIGLVRKIILEYYLSHYTSILTDDVHTEYGEKCIYKLLNQAKELGYKIFVLKNNNEKVYVDDLSKLDTYYSPGTAGLQYQFGIEK